MAKNTYRLAVVIALMLLVSMTAYAKQPALATAPANLLCNESVGTVTCTWDALEGAKKYAVAVIAGFDTTADCSSDTWMEFEYTVPAGDTPSVEFDIADLEYCYTPVDVEVCIAPYTIDMVKVKGLTVPVKGGGKDNGSQNNPFATAADLWQGTCID